MSEKQIKLPEPKKCSCGKVHSEVGRDHKATAEPDLYKIAYWWNCDCGSTMFYPIGKVVRAAA